MARRNNNNYTLEIITGRKLLQKTFLLGAHGNFHTVLSQTNNTRSAFRGGKNKLITHQDLRNDFHNRETEPSSVPKGERDTKSNDCWQQKLKVHLLSFYYSSLLNN